jgi:hypothetical protein
MNKEQLKKSIGKHVLLRPMAIGADTAGHDDEWCISTIREDAVELVNVRTEHRVVIGLDALITFTSDPARDGADGVKRGFLQLAVRVETLADGRGRIEPLPFARGGGAADGVNLLRLELRKAIAGAHLEVEEVIDLIRKCLQSRTAVWAADGLLRSGAMEKFKKNCASDAKQIGELKRSLPSEAQDFSVLAAAELEKQLVEVHRTQTRATQVRERYSRQLALDDERRREIRARAEAQIPRVRSGHA